MIQGTRRLESNAYRTDRCMRDLGLSQVNHPQCIIHSAPSTVIQVVEYSGVDPALYSIYSIQYSPDCCS